MTILKLFLLVVLIVSVGCSIYLIAMNRASDQLVSTALSAGATGAFGTLLVLIFSLKGDSLKLEFPSVMLVNRNTRLPFQEPAQTLHPYAFRVNTFYFVQEGLKKRLLGLENEQRDETYLNILHREVIEDLFLTYCVGWKVDFSDYNLPQEFPESQRRISIHKAPSASFQWAGVIERNPSNPFLQIAPVGFADMKLPPKTQLAFTNLSASRTIVLKNRFVEATIRVWFGRSGHGLGPLGRFLKLDEKTADDYVSYTFYFELEASFNATRANHPEMENYKKWITGMFNHLEREFNSQKRWETTSRELLLLERPLQFEEIKSVNRGPFQSAAPK